MSYSPRGGRNSRRHDPKMTLHNGSLSAYASARADGSGYVYKGYTVHHHITDKRVSFSQRILKQANGINLLRIVSMNY